MTFVLYILSGFDKEKLFHLFMPLTVPADSRNPIMGCVDYKDRVLVLFENGTLARLSHNSEDDDLRGGTGYEFIFSDLSKLKTKPSFSGNNLNDWDLLMKNYRKRVFFTYAVVLLFFSLQFIFKETWTSIFTNITNIDFTGWLKYVLGVFAFTIAMAPEIMLIQKIKDETLTLDLEKQIILKSIGELRKIHTTNQTPSKHIWYSTFGLFKGILACFSFVEFGFFIILIIIFPCWLIGIMIKDKVELRRTDLNQIQIKEVRLNQIAEYISEKWISSSLHQMLKIGESEKIEFKSSLWYDYHKAVETEESVKKGRYDPNYNPKNKSDMRRMAHNVVKGVCGLLNANKTGKLLIGIDDNSEILGLKNDFDIIGSSSNKLDEFNNKLDEILRSRLKSKGELHDLWNFIWHEVDGKHICMININRTKNGIFCEHDGKQIFYLRKSAKTTPIRGVELDKALTRFD